MMTPQFPSPRRRPRRPVHRVRCVGRNAILATHLPTPVPRQLVPPGTGIPYDRTHHLLSEGECARSSVGVAQRRQLQLRLHSEFPSRPISIPGATFVDRFDANSYLYITKALDYFDLARDYGSLSQAFAGTRARFLVVSFSSDWLFTPAQSEAIVDALAANGKDISFCNIDSSYGHDAFLLENETLGAFIRCFLAATSHPECVKVEDACCPKPTRRLGRHEQAHRARVDYQLVESLIEPDATVTGRRLRRWRVAGPAATGQANRRTRNRAGAGPRPGLRLQEAIYHPIRY